MPPRSRTKPGTARRPRVAGLRQHPAAAPEETTEIDGPDSGTTITATDTPTAPPRDAPVDTRTPEPSRSADAKATAPDTISTVATPAAASTPTETIPATDAAPTDPAPADATPADATPTHAERTDDAPADAASTESVATPGAATTTAVPTTETGRSEPDDDEATTRTATPTPAAKPRPARRKSAGSLTPNPSAGATATAVKERPARSRPAPEPEPGRLRRATRATGVAFGRFGRSRRALPITMVVVIVVCLALSGLAFWKGREAWTSGPVSNQAVIDVGATAEIVGQTRESIEKIFSYDFTKLDDSAEAARTMSTGAFTEQYLSVFDQTIRAPATQQQLRQTATVVNIGVNSIRDDRAEVMALVQFNAQRTSTGESTNAPGLLRLDMQRVDGRWKLAQLTPLTAPR